MPFCFTALHVWTVIPLKYMMLFMILERLIWYLEIIMHFRETESSSLENLTAQYILVSEYYFVLQKFSYFEFYCWEKIILL